MKTKHDFAVEAVDQARAVLQGQTPAFSELKVLCETLEKIDGHYWIRRVLVKSIGREGYDNEESRRLAQMLALATFKDPTLLRHQSFDKAIDVLDKWFDLKTSDDQETLGLAGSVYKRRWYLEGRREWLEQALHYYSRGYDIGVANDKGYTAVNAAFVADLLADAERHVGRGFGKTQQSANQHRELAAEIRREIVSTLSPEQDDIDYWTLVTLAEACFGLEDFDRAKDLLTKACEISGISEWQKKTTIEQLCKLAELQLSESELSDIGSTPQWAAIRALAGGSAESAQTLFAGKVGLALSGGGFRASLYHLGVLAKLAEVDMLRHVEVLSCVSGGSIIGAHYYLHLKALHENGRNLTGKPVADNEIRHAHYVKLVEDLIEEFVEGIQKNLRTRVIANPLTNLKMVLPWYSRTRRLGELYEQHLFDRVPLSKPETSKLRPLNNLFIQPPQEIDDFSPNRANWRRRNKIPQLVLNATNLNTGHLWSFTASWMGESPNLINPDVDKSDRYRRMYFDDAPKKYRDYPLAYAVAASSCVPGLFEPIVMESLYPDRTVRLVDGGVYDNLGIAALAEQDCSVMILSDASGQMDSDPNPKGGVLGPLLRTTSVMMHKVRSASYDDLANRMRGNLLKGLADVHLTQGLERADIGWIGQAATHENSNVAQSASTLGIRTDVQRHLSSIRTDLDAFSDTEAQALMNAGYVAMSSKIGNISGFPQITDYEHSWQFRQVDAEMRAGKSLDAEQEAKVKDFDRQLAVGSSKFARSWKLIPALKWSGVAAGILAMLALVIIVPGEFSLFETSFVKELLENNIIVEKISNFFTFKSVVFMLASYFAGKYLLSVLDHRFVTKLKKYLKLRSLLSRIWIITVVMGVGFVAAGVQLHIFDRLFLKRGQRKSVSDKQADEAGTPAMPSPPAPGSD